MKTARKTFNTQVKLSMLDDKSLDLDRLENLVAETYHQHATNSETLANALAARSDVMASAFEHLAIGLTMFDAENHLIAFNPCLVKIYDMNPAEIHRGLVPAELVSAMNAINIRERGLTVEAIQRIVKRLKDGQVSRREWTMASGRIVEMIFSLTKGGGWIAMHRDVTMDRRAAAEAKRLKMQDALTGLPNRAQFQLHLQQIEISKQPVMGCAVYYIGLDGIADVNEEFGQAVAENLLLKAATRLRNLEAPGCYVARLGGEQFAVVHETHAQAKVTAETFAEKLLATLTERYEVNRLNLHIGASLGIALAPQHGHSADELLQAAELAFQDAVQNNRGSYRLYEASLGETLKIQYGLEAELRRALAERQFLLHYQPLLDLNHNSICGFEALIRWQHPKRGLLLPADFMPVAEACGLMSRIGDWALREACQAAKSWPRHVKLSFNVSPTQFRATTFASQVASALSQSGLPASRLELELTEPMLMAQPRHAASILASLKDLGVFISVDDFGAGYATIASLRKFNINRIKIDRSFMRNLGDGEESLQVIEAVARLSSSLGMTTSIEGIETAEQLAAVRAYGCDVAQGYVVSEPRPAEEIQAMLNELHQTYAARMSA